MNFYCAEEYFENNDLQEIFLDKLIPESELTMYLNLLYEKCKAKHAFVVCSWFENQHDYDSDFRETSRSIECGFAISCLDSNKLVCHEFNGFFKDHELKRLEYEKVEDVEEFLNKNEAATLFNKLQQIRIQHSVHLF